ncbi:MAG: hypothetical protein A2831_01440 [Candidatus Yanofskybacteria bacterium RIFCSPHIGHO2_01_FULL_44_17]|uniref:Uncharacterized protein n=1 Tax=Candidatus Yanofskybacteria bacterium RIFCSPHIGHO2_01_FULL_44_17 TaxID=1802668 RepID=A0A1F8EX02_9BACT|nr:MAG: hypothetical protein A2831_01440 [Candidatus Yanofskybacteria bacterium RIFCSPHIGHO2_01_FULL_44_17]
MPTKTDKNEYATRGDLRELRQEINEDMRVHVGVLYEKFENEVKVVAESHQDIDRKVDKLDFGVGTLTDEVGKLNNKMDMVVETIGEIKTDISEIKNDLKNKTDIKDHKILEKRVSVLEATA